MTTRIRHRATPGISAVLLMAAAGVLWFGLDEDVTPRVVLPLAESYRAGEWIIDGGDSSSGSDEHSRLRSNPAIPQPRPEPVRKPVADAPVDSSSGPQQPQRPPESDFLAALYSQAYDPAFFAIAQAQLNAATAAQADGSVQLRGLDCGSTMCRVQFAYSDPAAFSEFIDSLPQFLQWNAEMSLFVQGNPNAGYSANFYLTRQSDELTAAE